MKSVNPKKIDPQSTLFRVTAADVAWLMNEHGYSLDDMDPHVWARVRKAVDMSLSNLWADQVADAVQAALSDTQ
jgi:hypothetical protein